MLHALREHLHTELSARKHYFQTSKTEIAHQNIHLQVSVCSFALALLLIFFVLTPFIFPNWSISLPYLIFAALMFLYLVVSIYALYHHTSGCFWSYVSPFLVCLTMIICMIIIDTYSVSKDHCTYTPIFLAVSAALFILPSYIYYFFLLFSTAFFIVMDYHFKSPALFRTDIYNALVGMSMGFVLYQIIMQLRVNDNSARSNLTKLSQTDLLTGILNKISCEYAITEYIELFQNKPSCAFLIMDVDSFKAINDTYGHKFGDHILIEVSNLLTNRFRNYDIIGRFGGDEFVILIKDVSDVQLIQEKCELLLSEIKALISNETSLSSSCSIGVAITQDEEVSYSKLFTLADNALYEAKAFGKGRYVLHYYTSTQYNTDEKLMLVVDDSDVNRAIMRSIFCEDFTILEASDGYDALNLLSLYAGQISIVLLDIVMPNLDGYGVLKYMKSRTDMKKIPIVVISADVTTESQALQLGASDMIPQPVKPEIAKLRVANALKSH